MTREDFIAMGFVPATYEGQDGEFLLIEGKTEDFPYVKSQVIDGSCVCEGMKAYLEQRGRASPGYSALA